MNTGEKKMPADSKEGNADISPEERKLLDESMENMISRDNDHLRRSALDMADNDGELLNQASFDLTGEDLDIPGAELDDEAEKTGGEDEENNGYSVADTE